MLHSSATATTLLKALTVAICLSSNDQGTMIQSQSLYMRMNGWLGAIAASLAREWRDARWYTARLEGVLTKIVSVTIQFIRRCKSVRTVALQAPGAFDGNRRYCCCS
jgi:hypothetical protein